MCVVDPMANLKVAIQRSARDRAVREGVGSGTFLPATRLIVEVLDGTRDLELTTGLLEDASLLDASVAQAMISLHLHVARFIESCRNHGQIRPAADALLLRSTFNRLSESVLKGHLVPAPIVATQATVTPRPALNAATIVEAVATPMQAMASRSPWPAPVADTRLLVAA
jgi:hypothetical protein